MYGSKLIGVGNNEEKGISHSMAVFEGCMGGLVAASTELFLHPQRLLHFLV